MNKLHLSLKNLITQFMAKKMRPRGHIFFRMSYFLCRMTWENCFKGGHGLVLQVEKGSPHPPAETQIQRSPWG